jgi:hypothetical protein
VTARRLPHRVRAAAGALLLLVLAGCARPVEGTATTARGPVLPASAAELEPLIVTTVPSGLPRLPDASVSPPAGPKSLDDVSSYAADPSREREVLVEYGYRFGWERFWGRGARQTSVFVDQFRRAAGARTFASDLARNDATHYRATPQKGTGGLPAGCRLLTVAGPRPGTGLDGPAAFAWCSRGVFSVAVTAVSDTPAHALDEVSAVVRAQLARLG